MYTIEAMVDFIMPGGCGGWSSEAHRDLAIKVCLFNPIVNNISELAEICKILNGFDAKTLQEREEYYRKRGIIK